MIMDATVYSNRLHYLTSQPLDLVTIVLNTCSDLHVKMDTENLPALG